MSNVHNNFIFNPRYPKQRTKLKDYGPCPFVVIIEEATKQNDYYRICIRQLYFFFKFV